MEIHTLPVNQEYSLNIVCHDDRVVELKEQLEVEEADGNRQEKEVEAESGEASQESAPWMEWR